MSVNQLIYIYLLTIPVFFAIDLLWLGVFAKKFYQEQIGHLLGSVNWSAAIIFYLLYIVGIIFFAVYPALMASSFAKAVLLGALFGFFDHCADLRGFCFRQSGNLGVIDRRVLAEHKFVCA